MKNDTFRWVKTDTASIMFSALTTKKWGRTFRLTAGLDRPVEPLLLARAVSDVLPYYPNLRLSLRRGFFWTYQTFSGRLPEIRPEGRRPLQPITSRYRGLPDFRLVYRDHEVSLESSHSIGDGRGVMREFEEILSRYLSLQEGSSSPYTPFVSEKDSMENAFDMYFDKNGPSEEGKMQKAFHFEECWTPDYIRLLFAEMDEQHILDLAHARDMTVTEYLCAVLIAGVIRAADGPVTAPVTIAVPVDLRRFFPTKSLRNFTIQSYISFDPAGRADWSVDEICKATFGQLRDSLTVGHMQPTLNRYGKLRTNPVLRAVPYFIKRPVLVKAQNATHAAVTTIFTNLGERTLPPALQGRVTRLRFVNGDTRSYGLAVTASCVSCNGTLSLCFSRANRDTSWFDACVSILRAEGVEVHTSSIEGAAPPEAPETPREKTPFSMEKLKAYFNF
ncbi:MAG: hypothetical protein IJK02_06925 [Clostridia bacterium]|nr:hypothetical protein [Clostridia bacterium]